MILFRLLHLLTLLLFSLRRLLFALTALLTPVPTSARPIGDELDLLVLVPCHNDGPSLPALVQALLDNGYSHEQLRILLIDDDSTDNRSELIAALAVANTPVHALNFPQKAGKAAALNQGLELFLFSSGYLDRLALLVAFAQILSDRVLGTRFDIPGRTILGVLLLPYLQVIAALVRTKAGLAWWMRLPYLVLMFPVDLAVALNSTTATLLRRRRIWAPTPRTQPTELAHPSP